MIIFMTATHFSKSPNNERESSKKRPKKPNLRYQKTKGNNRPETLISYEAERLTRFKNKPPKQPGN